MHKFYTASYDASVYLQQPTKNTGRDEIIEIGKFYYTGTIYDIGRTLIKFDINSISSSIASGEISGSWKAYLNLKAAYSEGIPLDYTIYGNAVSQSWAMGQFTKFDSGSTSSQLSASVQQGVSWRYRDGVSLWQANTIGGTAVFAPGTTGSANAEGGTWYTGSQASQSYSYNMDDVHMDITGICNFWLSGSIQNNGIILRHGLSNEQDSLDYGILKFFSKESNTIYQPNLEIVWNDSVINTGSLSPVTGYAEDDYKVVLTNLKSKYQSNTKVMIRVKGRDKYPLKSFSTTFEYNQSKYLPATTYYQLEDYITGEIIIPFDSYSKVSCDSTSNYFILDLSSLPIFRTYKIKLKIVDSNITTIIDDKLIFEII
jgi:hypothetical protein